MSEESKVAFVTGGTGFVGSHLVEALLEQGYTEVRCLVRSRMKWLEGLDVVPVRADLSDVEALWEAVEGVDYVYHVAGLTRAREWEAFEKANVTGTLNLLGAVRQAAPDVSRVLITSSLAAIGPCEGLADESTPLEPISMYGRSKAEMEQRLQQPLGDGTVYAEALPLTVVRPPAVYGPRESDIFTFFQSIDRRVCPVVGGGADEPAISLIHVDDLVRGMIVAAEAPEAEGETYFLSSERPYSWNEVKAAATDALGHGALTIPVPRPLIGMVGAVAEAFGNLTGSYPPLNREKAREIRYTCTKCSMEKARRDLGFEQRMPLPQGVDEAIKWYQSEGWL